MIRKTYIAIFSFAFLALLSAAGLSLYFLVSNNNTLPKPSVVEIGAAYPEVKSRQPGTLAVPSRQDLYGTFEDLNPKCPGFTTGGADIKALPTREDLYKAFGGETEKINKCYNTRDCRELRALYVAKKCDAPCYLEFISSDLERRSITCTSEAEPLTDNVTFQSLGSDTAFTSPFANSLKFGRFAVRVAGKIGSAYVFASSDPSKLECTSGPVDSYNAECKVKNHGKVDITIRDFTKRKVFTFNPDFMVFFPLKDKKSGGKDYKRHFHDNTKWCSQMNAAPLSEEKLRQVKTIWGDLGEAIGVIPADPANASIVGDSITESNGDVKFPTIVMTGTSTTKVYMPNSRRLIVGCSYPDPNRTEILVAW